MAKKLIKRDIVDTLLNTNKEEKQNNLKTEDSKNIKKEKQKNIETEKDNDKIKVTLYLSREDDILIDEIRKFLYKSKKSGKISRSEVVSMALKDFSQKLRIN